MLKLAGQGIPGLAITALLAGLLTGCGHETSSGRADAPLPQSETETRQLSAGHAVAPAAASPDDDGQWTMPAKDYANTRFSGLTQINKANVANLQVALTFSSGTTSGQESAAIMVHNTIYFV